MTALYHQHRRHLVVNPANERPERNSRDVDFGKGKVALSAVERFEGSEYRSCSKSKLDLPPLSALVPVMHSSDNSVGEYDIPFKNQQSTVSPDGFQIDDVRVESLTGRQWRGGIVGCVRWGWYAIVGALASCESPPRAKLPRRFCVALH